MNITSATHRIGSRVKVLFQNSDFAMEGIIVKVDRLLNNIDVLYDYGVVSLTSSKMFLQNEMYK